MDSDVQNADSHLQVEFYTFKHEPHEGVPFVRIKVPGDTTNVIDKPATDHDKQRFIRQWLHFQGKETGEVVGTPLTEWNKEFPDQLTDNRLMELQVLQFQTVEQVTQASDAQIQRLMGGAGLREQARSYLSRRHSLSASGELDETKRQLAALQSQMAELLAKKKPGRKPKSQAV